MPTLRQRRVHELHTSIRKQLFDATNDGRLKSGVSAVFDHLRRARPPERVSTDPDAHALIGGEKDRRRESARFVRDDDAWFHFTITVVEDGNGPLQLIAYDYEIVFPEGHIPPFVRLDLNPPMHRNVSRDLRSHVHPGNDDMHVPAPIVGPEEAIDWLLNGFR